MAVRTHGTNWVEAQDVSSSSLFLNVGPEGTQKNLEARPMILAAVDRTSQLIFINNSSHCGK